MTSTDVFNLDDLDDDSLSTISTRSGSAWSRDHLPYVLRDYFTEGNDPNAHHMVVCKPEDAELENPELFRLFLDPNDPMAHSQDSNSARRSISDFEYRELRDALLSNDRDRIVKYAADAKSHTFTEIGGLIVAEQVRAVGPEAPNDLICRWIRPIKSSAKDSKHRAYFGYATVRSTARNGFRAEILYASDAILCRDFDAVKAALLTAFQPNEGQGAAYLRKLIIRGNAIQKADIIAGKNILGGRIDNPDKQVGSSYVPRTPEEGVENFCGTDLGKKLASAKFGDAVIEVIPAMVINFGSKTIEEAAKRANKRDGGGAGLNLPFVLPDTVGAGPEGSSPVGWANSTIRLTSVEKAGSTDVFWLAASIHPMNGQLLDTAEVPTSTYAPQVEGKYAPRRGKAAKPDPAAPLDGNFAV